MDDQVIQKIWKMNNGKTKIKIKIMNKMSLIECLI